MKLSKRELVTDICILLLLLPALFLAWKAPTRQDLTVDFFFRQVDDNVQSQFFWGVDGALSAENCADGVREGREVHFAIPQAPADFGMFRLDPSNTDSVYSITRISFFLNGERFLYLTPEQIMEQFLPVNASWELSGEELVITPSTSDSGLLTDNAPLRAAAIQAAADMRALLVRERVAAALLLACALLLLSHCFDSLSAFVRSFFQKGPDGRFDWFSLTACAVMAGALLVTAVIGLFSALGMHPDEWDVKACLDYGMTHFFPPDIRDPAVAGTYSGYGYTKLENYTWYFLAAGKVALVFKVLFHSLQYYRIPNLLLFLLMAVLFVRNIRRKRWYMAAFGICVQAWYIFSYTTADALDFVWAFLAVCLLAEENSFLYRAVGARRITLRNFRYFLLTGALYGMIALGKPNYLAVLALTFFVLLFRLIREKGRPQRALLWRNYFVILGIFAAVFLFRLSFDIAHYGTNRAAVKDEVAIQYADYDKNPATPEEEQSASWHMRSRGVTLSGFFAAHPEWLPMSYKSLCGLLQDMDSGPAYYIAMGALYVLILTGIGIASFRSGGLWGRLEFVTGVLLMAAGLAASVANSYLVDMQPQGRYLLPMVLIAGYLASRVPKLLEKRSFQALLAAAGLLSVAYYGLVGIPLFL